MNADFFLLQLYDNPNIFFVYKTCCCVILQIFFYFFPVCLSFWLAIILPDYSFRLSDRLFLSSIVNNIAHKDSLFLSLCIHDDVFYVYFQKFNNLLILAGRAIILSEYSLLLSRLSFFALTPLIWIVCPCSFVYITMFSMFAFKMLTIC